MKLFLLLFVLATSVVPSESFSPCQSLASRLKIKSLPLQLLVDGPAEDGNNKKDKDEEISKNVGDFPPVEEANVEYEGSVDWDAEWKKVVAKQNEPVERPGKGYYKTDAEIAAIRAANKATEKFAQAASNLPSVPTWRSLQGDWKFWVGLLALISVGTSLIAASGSGGTPMSGQESYYI